MAKAYVCLLFMYTLRNMTCKKEQSRYVEGSEYSNPVVFF